MIRFCVVVLVVTRAAQAFSGWKLHTQHNHLSISQNRASYSTTRLRVSSCDDECLHSNKNIRHETCQQAPSTQKNPHFAASAASVALSLSMLAGILAVPMSPTYADEFGVETEAPTLFTGETVMICTKRGPLGACLKTELRTAENDNDKASKYMKSPEGEIRDKDLAMRAAATEQTGGELIERLRRQTEENREKNRRTVEQKTFENDQSASFGPFDRQKLVTNANGDGFTLLTNPQAMRLKKAGYIKDGKFVKQPSQEVIEEALEPGPGLVDTVKGFFGGGGGSGASSGDLNGDLSGALDESAQLEETAESRENVVATEAGDSTELSDSTELDDSAGGE